MIYKYTKNKKISSFSYIYHAKFFLLKHSMFIEEEYEKYWQELPYPNWEEYSILEKVDLIDFWENNGHNKKRRSLLC